MIDKVHSLTFYLIDFEVLDWVVAGQFAVLKEEAALNPNLAEVSALGLVGVVGVESRKVQAEQSESFVLED